MLVSKILWPPITDTPYPLNRLKLYRNQSFWTNKHYLWSSCDSLHFGHQKFYDPPIFLSKNLWPPVYLGPPSKENASPLRPSSSWDIDQNNNFHILNNDPRTAEPTKMLMAFISFLDNLHDLLQDKHIIFF